MVMVWHGIGYGGNSDSDSDGDGDHVVQNLCMIYASTFITNILLILSILLFQMDFEVENADFSYFFSLSHAFSFVGAPCLIVISPELQIAFKIYSSQQYFESNCCCCYLGGLRTPPKQNKVYIVLHFIWQNGSNAII